MKTFELLPDELLIEIAEYLTVFDLYRCFTGLNQRFDAILYSVPLRLVLKDVGSYEMYRVYLHLYAGNVNRLYVKCLQHDVDVRPFYNLRLLHLKEITHEQLQQITPTHLPCLNRLTVVVAPIDNQYFTDILFGQSQFSNLIQCWLPTIVFKGSNLDQLHRCTTLRSLRLNFCHINTFYKLLSLIPNLVSFESDFIPSQSTIDIDQSYSNLNHLKIHLRNCMTLNNLDSILKPISSLKRLQLRMNVSNSDTDKFNSYRLIKILRQRVLQLIRLKIELQVSSIDIKNDLDDVCKMSSLFSEFHLEQCLAKVISIC